MPPFMHTARREINMDRNFRVLKEFPYLDKGYVKLLNVTGTDETIVLAARTSYGTPEAYEEDKKNTGLISYLREHHHTSCFELCNVTIQIKLPLFTAAQVDRHRTARQNQLSGRYTQLPRDYWVPSKKRIGSKSHTHKQGTGEPLSDEKAQRVIDIIEQHSKACLEAYDELLALEVSNEIARSVLAVNFYTVKVWQMDLNNLMKFITLRSHSTAQDEIVEMANILANIMEEYFPATWASYVNHIRESATFSKEEMAIIGSAFMKACEETEDAETNNPYDVMIKYIQHEAFSKKFSDRKRLNLIRKLKGI